MAETSGLGDTLRRFLNLVSHRSSSVFAVMDKAGITLPQVILLSRIDQFGAGYLSEIKQASNVSAPAVSQMIDRLVQQGLLNRVEDRIDRRRKTITVTRQARRFLRRLEAARSAEYELGLTSIGSQLRADIAKLLERAISEIERSQVNHGRNRIPKETGSPKS